MKKLRQEARAVTSIDRERVIATLRGHQAELLRRGVRHAALFGSIARGEGKRTSDIDILIELDPQAPVGLFEYVAITQYLADLFLARVDVANHKQFEAARPADDRARRDLCFLTAPPLDHAGSVVTTRRRPSAASAASSCSRRTAW